MSRDALRMAAGLVLMFVLPGILQGLTSTAGQTLDRAERLFDEGDLEGSRAAFEQAVPAFRSAGDRKGLGRALRTLGLLYSELGHYGAALATSRESAAIHRRLGDRAGEARSTNNAGLALLYMGGYNTALAEFEKALALHRADRSAEDEIIVLNNIGNVFYFQGRYLDALQRYQSAMDRVDRSAGAEWAPHERLRTSANLAVLFQKIGRYDLALNLYAGLRATPGILSRSESARVLSNLGSLYRRLGDAVKALEAYREAIELFQQQKHVDGEIGALKNIGIARALDLGDLPGALDSFRRARDLARESHNGRELVQTGLYMAEALRRAGDLAAARVELEAALEGAGKMGIVEEHWKALHGLGWIALRSGDIPGAERCLQEAIAVIESARSRLRLSSLRSEFLADKRAVYDARMEAILARLGRRDPGPQELEQIHRVMELSRARNFRDQMSDSLEDAMLQQHPELGQELRELRAQMSLLWSRRLRADGAETDRLNSEFSALEQRYIEIERTLAGSSGSPGTTPVAALRQIRERLDDTTAVLEFWTGENELVVLWATRRGAGISRQPLTSGQMREMDECNSRISQEGSTGWRAACAGTSGLLLGDVLARLDPEITALAVVQDEHSRFLPLEALPVPGGNGVLVERYTIFYLPSASMIVQSRPGAPWMARAPWSRSLLALGDPVFSGEDVASPGEPARLAYSREEVSSAAAIIGGRTRVYLDAGFTKRRLEPASVRDYRILHISSHAAVDPENPQRSRILFSADDPTGPPNYLFLGELLSLNFRGLDLVVLSGCETARGKTVRGEGSQDFSRAFLMNGASCAVASLWRVRDQPTAEFMKQFYYYLAAGHSTAGALRQAKLRFLSSPGSLSHPCHWAAFVASGEALGKPAIPVSWAALLAILAALAAGSGALAAILRSRGRVTRESAARS